MATITGFYSSKRYPPRDKAGQVMATKSEIKEESIVLWRLHHQIVAGKPMVKWWAVLPMNMPVSACN
jgi:hypothetical protein